MPPNHRPADENKTPVARRNLVGIGAKSVAVPGLSGPFDPAYVAIHEAEPMQKIKRIRSTIIS